MSEAKDFEKESAWVKKNQGGDNIPDAMAENVSGKDVDRELNAELASDIKRASSAGERERLKSELAGLREKKISLGGDLLRARAAALNSQLASVGDILAADTVAGLDESVFEKAVQRIIVAQGWVNVLVAASEQLSQNIKAVEARLQGDPTRP